MSIRQHSPNCDHISYRWRISLSLQNLQNSGASFITSLKHPTKLSSITRKVWCSPLCLPNWNCYTSCQKPWMFVIYTKKMTRKALQMLEDCEACNTAFYLQHCSIRDGVQKFLIFVRVRLPHQITRSTNLTARPQCRKQQKRQPLLGTCQSPNRVGPSPRPKQTPPGTRIPPLSSSPPFPTRQA